jgi:hypothetical protein
MATTHALAFVLLCAVPVAAQPVATPQMHLDRARQILDGVAVPLQTDEGKKLATLKEHFAELATMYLLPASRPDAASSVAAPVGTTGTAPSDKADWRPKYRVVENDLDGLIAASSARDQLEDFRRELRMFYAGTMGQPGAISGGASPSGAALPAQAPAAAAAMPRVETEFGTALALIDRMQRILDEAAKDEMGKVSLDRANIDELRAELAQIRTILEARSRESG